MYKLSFYRSSVSLISKGFINFAAAILVLLITFNLGWLIAFIRLYTQVKTFVNINKILFNLEAILLLGNLSILTLFVICILSIKSLRAIMSK